uniref:SJCHGC03259 protein n=1 Tax=Schistosoma japonicum TaxID=6182 RepID=Q5DCY4_SCHJA|nr:SJCHGC03259 protein [Schistosoma japonicum]
MTARELNNLIAFQMRIFDSKDFGLFAYINGTEIQLDDELRIAEFTGLDSEISHSMQLHSATVNISSRSQTGTPNSLKDPDSAHFKSHISISSRSDSATSSSSESRSQTLLRRVGKSNRSRAAWWIMCGSNGQTKHQLVGSVQNPLYNNATGHHENLPIHKPVLVYKRRSGYFALSDRLLRGLGLKSIPQQNSELSPSGKPEYIVQIK